MVKYNQSRNEIILAKFAWEKSVIVSGGMEKRIWIDEMS